MERTLRVSVDTGGTFTDVLAVDSQTGAVSVIKTPSNRLDPSQALLEGIEKVLALAERSYDDVELVIHGTTTATNAVLEHEFSGIGLLVTDGFRHLLEIARQSVPDGYGNSFFWVKPPRIVPLHLVREIPERLRFDGTVIDELDEDAVRRAAADLVAQGVNRLAVCFLHSYANPDHELRVKDLLSAEFPELFVSISSSVLPEYREYERAMTTLVDVMVKPYCHNYLNRAQRKLKEHIGELPFLIMQSNAGVVSAKVAADTPVSMLLSGPAGGVLGAIEAARTAGINDLITLDVGGTSTDVSLVDNLEIRLTGGTVIEDYPVKVPMIDIETVGTGGGSLAWVGPNNALKVGPKSSGAIPGPICYRRGGVQPTVTDAAAVLGLFPNSLVGGDLELDVDSARNALEKFGSSFGLSAEDAASGVLEVATAGQVTGIRQVSTLKGRDPSRYCLVAFGGAGPLLAAAVADFLGMKTVLIPPNPGNLSALGLQVTDVKRDYVRTHVRMVQQSAEDEAAGIWVELEEQGRLDLREEGVPAERVELARGADMRYEGEGYEVAVTLASGTGTQTLGDAADAFHKEHERLYGFSYPGKQNVELVNLRVQAIGRTYQPGILGQIEISVAAPLPRTYRSVYWRTTGWIECPIYDRSSLRAGDRLHGPAVVEDYGATITVPHGWDATVDIRGNLLMSKENS